jgi:phage tail-like protein
MTTNSTGHLLSHLPGIYHSSQDLRELLSVFEEVLFGPDKRALEPQIARIHSYFDAFETPDEFLSWFSEWVALSHKIGLSTERQRKLVATIVPLYAQRGTKVYLTKLLEFFSPQGAVITVEDQELRGFMIGRAEIGVDSWLERDRAFWFKVKIRSPSPEASAARQAQLHSEWQERARQVIDLAKPAHTMYELDWAFEDVKKQNLAD